MLEGLKEVPVMMATDIAAYVAANKWERKRKEGETRKGEEK